MPFVPASKYEQLRADNARMHDALDEFEEMRPFLDLATEVRDEIVRILAERGDLDAPEIGEQAYQSVLQRHASEARDEVVARYEQQHRQTLYERLLGEIAINDGDEILAEVKQRLETDPALALELRDSARRELAARAIDVVRTEISAEQDLIVQAEADRQIKLDHFDVRLSLERKLDLNDPELLALLQPDDKLDLLIDIGNGKRGRVSLIWTKDAADHLGWAYGGSSEQLIELESRAQLSVNRHRFVEAGVSNVDMVRGTEVVQPGQLVVGLPLVLQQNTPNGGRKIIKLAYTPRDTYHAYGAYEIAKLIGMDLQTKNLVFTNQY